MGTGSGSLEALAALWLGQEMLDSSPFFAELNRVLLTDDEQELRACMHVIRLVADHVARPEHRLEGDLTAWRGSKLTHEQAASLRSGEVICPPMFLATSTSRHVAEVFRDTFLVKIQIPRLHSGAGVIHKKDPAPGEVILPPYTPLRVVEVRSDCVVELQALCGLDHLYSPGNSARCFPV